MTHGIRHAYQQGCRCLLCRAANARYHRALYRRPRPYVNAKEAGAIIRKLLTERYTRQQIGQQSGLCAEHLDRLSARSRCRLKTLLQLRRAVRILLAEDTNDTNGLPEGTSEARRQEERDAE